MCEFFASARMHRIAIESCNSRITKPIKEKKIILVVYYEENTVRP